MTDKLGIYISESSINRILRKRDLISAPNHILVSAANEFKDKNNFVHQMWETDYIYLKIIGWL